MGDMGTNEEETRDIQTTESDTARNRDDDGGVERGEDVEVDQLTCWLPKMEFPATYIKVIVRGRSERKHSWQSASYWYMTGPLSLRMSVTSSVLRQAQCILLHSRTGFDMSPEG